MSNIKNLYSGETKEESVNAFFAKPKVHPTFTALAPALRSAMEQWCGKMEIIERPFDSNEDVLDLKNWTSRAEDYALACAYLILCKQMDKSFTSPEQLSGEQKNRYRMLINQQQKKQKQKLYALLYKLIF